MQNNESSHFFINRINRCPAEIGCIQFGHLFSGIHVIDILSNAFVPLLDEEELEYGEKIL
ncbi:hypothetical protein CN470_27325 [Bacillus cereus]|nr:hypothetical protein BCAH1134_C0538 [Bacillus cereus AH1134]PEQ57552.1 hypothetical protein CN470_27325 [Bacillus cereus]PET56520.1 hypothetical protein CN536_24415 [Bacillus cereus]PFA40676.1 hypothetical protein CN381_25385 [Bacillus cereus]PFS88411.1 hypothetical protein COK58_28715 [Bacillus cereus]